MYDVVILGGGPAGFNRRFVYRPGQTITLILESSAVEAMLLDRSVGQLSGISFRGGWQ
jgi:thioredoxin reductase